MPGFDIFISYVFVFGFGLICGSPQEQESFGGGLMICIICAIIEITRLLTFANA